MTIEETRDARETWRRRFAVDCDNAAWNAADGCRAGDDARELLNAAHAAAFHWSAVGSELNRIRSKPPQA